MRFTDDILMAYADGELDAATREALELAMQKDLSLAHRVAQYKAMRADVFASFVPAGEEAGPPRLARPQRRATVVSLDAVRARRDASQHAARKAGRRRAWSWPEFGALAATLVTGVLLGYFAQLHWPIDGTRGGDSIASRDGSLSAQGKLAQALEQQLASAGASGAVKIGSSFLARDGVYCRSFITGSSGQELAGLACKNNGEWRIPVLVQRGRATPQGAYRLAAAEMPPQVLDAIEQRSSGPALDARAELEVAQRGWQPGMGGER
jgi:hypothetical protein